MRAFLVSCRNCTNGGYVSWSTELGEVDGTLLKSNSDAIVDVTTIVFRRAPVKRFVLATTQLWWRFAANGRICHGFGGMRRC